MTDERDRVPDPGREAGDGHDHHDHDPDYGDDGHEDPRDRDDDRPRAASGDGAEGDLLRLSVPDMDCPSCAGKVESSVSRLDGILAVDPRPTTGTLSVQYAADETDPDAIRERVERAGYAVRDSVTETLSVPDMDCPSCAGKVENALDDVGGVVSYDTRPAAGTVRATYDPDATSREAVAAAIRGAGYDVADADAAATSPHDVWLSGRAIRTGIGAVFLVAGILLEFVLGGANVVLGTALGREFTLAWVAYLLAAALPGAAILRNGYYSAINRSLDIDLLMSAGIVGALLVDLPFEAATLAVLFSVAELLERFSMDRARDSLRELMELSPDVATVRRGEDEQVVPVEDVAVGETVVVRPGDRVPLDGVVSDGRSAVDESPITGESVPVDKEPGDEVFAGSINEEGFLAVSVTAASADSTLARVIDLVEEAGAGETRHERFIDRFARYYTPVIVAGSILTVLLSPALFGVAPAEAFRRGLTLLVIACPCAFVISTPVSVVSGVTSAARNGVLIKGGAYLEALGGVDVVALDKTGTLTMGELGVTDVVTLNGTDEGELLACARAIESRSEHPIAAAITAFADERGVPDREIADFEAIPGKGVTAELDGERHYAGKPALFADLGFDLGHAHVATDGGVAEASACEHGAYLDLANETLPRLQAEGKSVVVVGTADELEGVIAVADTVRPEAERTVARLHDLGLDVAMLTGDNERTARAIAERLGIDDVRADLLPGEKVDAVESLRERGEVAMVGDGVNDAPALATADVGVAMGAAGTDTALETADVALMADDLGKLPYLFRLSRRATGVIRQNVWSSLAVKAALAVGAPLGLVSVMAAIVVGDMGMSLGVTANAMRLAGVKPD